MKIVLLLALASGCWCFSSGPPINTASRRAAVCEQLWPQGHGSIAGQQQGDGGFLIRTNLSLNQQGDTFTYTAGATYQIVIVDTQSSPIRGFLMQARNQEPGGMLIGTFVGLSDRQQTLNCDDMMGVSPDATVSHSNLNQGQDISLTWVAPLDSNGEVSIRFTIVVTMPVYYIARNAAQVLENPPTSPPAEPTPLAEGLTPPSMVGADYRLTFSSPQGCMPEDCLVFAGIDTNSGNQDYLDFYLSGQAESWVAVGFTPTRSMFNADVLGCYVNTTSELVEAVDTWNTLDPTRRNIFDTVQDTTLFNSSAENGTITCTFVRSIGGSIVLNEDLNLNASLYVMYGYSDISIVTLRDTGPALLHNFGDRIPTLSVQRFNVVTDTRASVVVETERNAEDYRLTFRTPAGCNVSDCTVFVGIDTNNISNQFLDIYITGKTEAWLAVGFSETNDMFSADVLGCNLNSNTRMVEVLDTYNDDEVRINFVDRSQDVIVFNTSAADGTITCVFAKPVKGNSVESGEDLNLNSSYWVMYGLRAQDPAPRRLGQHEVTPTITPLRINPVLDNDTDLIVDPVVLPAGVVLANLAPTNYRLLIRNPPGCEPDDCDVFVGIGTNQGNASYLDFYLQGSAQAWVAVGFSDTQSMFDADVLGCNINAQSDMVEVLDTWNPSAPIRGNSGDTLIDTFLFSGSSQNGRITCEFTRLAVGSNPPDAVEDLDLTNDHYIMFGVGPMTPGAGGSLPAHVIGGNGNPALSAQRVNPFTFQGDIQGDETTQRLIRAHGILMLIAWPLMAVTAIFFAAWMRPALPNGEWFQVHRVLMVGSIVVASIGFILIFVAYRNGNPPGLLNLSGNFSGTAHLVIGVVVMFLHLLNPLISICRCKPDSNNRWIFNILHGTFIGVAAELLALTNVGIGLAVFSQKFSRFQDLTILYVYLGYLGFFLVMILALFIIFTIIAYTSEDKDRGTLAPSLVKPLISSNANETRKRDIGVELTVSGHSPTINQDEDLPKPKNPSRDAPLRWGSLLVFMVVVIAFIVVLVVMVGIN